MPVAIASLPFDTSLYDAFPISAFIFEALPAIKTIISPARCSGATGS